MPEWNRGVMGMKLGDGPVSDGECGAVLVDYQDRVHARVESLLVGLGEGLAVGSDSQSATCRWNRNETTLTPPCETYFSILFEALEDCLVNISARTLSCLQSQSRQ